MLNTWEDKCYRSPGGTEELCGVASLVSSVTPKFMLIAHPNWTDAKYLSKLPRHPRHRRSCQCCHVDNPLINLPLTNTPYADRSYHPLPDIFFGPNTMNVVHDEVVRNFSKLRLYREGAALEAKHPEGNSQCHWISNSLPEFKSCKRIYILPAHNSSVLMPVFVFISSESVVTNGSSVQKNVPLVGSWPSSKLQACWRHDHISKKGSSWIKI